MEFQDQPADPAGYLPHRVRARNGDTGEVIAYDFDEEGDRVKVQWNDQSETWENVEDMRQI